LEPLVGTIAVISLIRIHAEGDDEPTSVDQLTQADATELLQLDYARPRLAPYVQRGTPELPEVAESFMSSLPKLSRRLYLEPEFRIITSAGWGNSYGVVERVGQAITAGGCPDIPVSAVRGSSLTGILEFLVANGLRLDNAATGAPWKTLRAPVISADVHLGAGPIATALSEGARVVVAGCYDGAAPSIAAAVHRFNWKWQDLDSLANAAAAARAAIWPHRHSSDAITSLGGLPLTLSVPRVALHQRGFTVDLGHEHEPDDPQRLLTWLQGARPEDSSQQHADVGIDASQAVITRMGPTQLRVEGCRGVRSEPAWHVDVLYQAGFVAETLVEFGSAATSVLRHQVGQAFQSRFVDANNEHSLVSVQELGDVTGEGPSWLHMACRAQQGAACVEFVDSVARFAGANRELVRLPAGRPAVRVDCGVWPARIPRNAIDIAVDTRPAKEWV
jgi:hypothetical protein